MEWENIILTGACFAAIVVVAYYFWKKSTSQTQQMEELNKRIEAIELVFAPQPSHATLDTFFPISSYSTTPQTQYTFVDVNKRHKATEDPNNQKIRDVTDLETKNKPSPPSSQVDENELAPLLIKSNRSMVDLNAITDNLLPIISSK